MLAPTYVSENSPRAIRGFLVGFFQLLLVMGGMMAYFINYGSLLHLPVSAIMDTDLRDMLTLLPNQPRATWMVPLACQSICPALLFLSMLLCPESPRWLASQDLWEKATAVLSDVRQLPPDHAYIQQELLELRTQLDQERAIMQDTGFLALQKECWTIPANRKRALLTAAIISFQQWSGVSYSSGCFALCVVHGNRRLTTHPDRRHQLLRTHNLQGPRPLRYHHRPIRSGSLRHCQGGNMLDLHVLPSRYHRSPYVLHVEWLRPGYLHVLYWFCKHRDFRTTSCHPC